jgi:predicted ATP-dependent serine protease
MNSGSSPGIGPGIAGLDKILAGPLPRHRLYLIEGNPGTGKTTMALQFLIEARYSTGVRFSLSNSSSPAVNESFQHLQVLGNVTLIERPVRTVTLLSAVRAALRSRRRQYEARLISPNGFALRRP